MSPIPDTHIPYIPLALDSCQLWDYFAWLVSPAPLLFGQDPAHAKCGFCSDTLNPALTFPSV